ncbi:MAG TPA: xanthine dehydrogenase family protein molybdopterin-binding subunit [Thermoanaerobaculia bacterium]
MGDEKKTIVLTHGIAPGTLGTIERDVPAAEPPPLPPNKDLAAIGKRVPRLDARAKVTGAAKYTADIRLPGMLWARMVTAPHPHARILKVDTTAAAAYPGVRAVHVIENVLGGAVAEEKDRSPWPLVRYQGQPVAAVAAVSQTIADEAARLVRVEYEPLPFTVDMEEAQTDGAPVIFPAPAVQAETAGGGGGGGGVPQKGNVRGPMGRPRGDAAKALAEADVVVSGEYRTQVQTHSTMEPHGAVADWRPDGLTVWASTQDTLGSRDELAELFGLPQSRVRVVTEFMGGGFGSKFGTGNTGAVATHLSKKAGAPVRLMLDRHDEQLSTGNRPSSSVKMKIGAKRDGTIVAIDAESRGTAGVGTGAGALTPAQTMYDVPNVRTAEYDVFTNAGPGAAMRAPGHPQGCFALEQTIDALAETLGMDPLALREKNDRHAARREERRIGAEKFGWSRRRPPASDQGAVKRGIGVAQSVWFRIADLDTAAEVRILRDGSVELFSGVQDIGTGIRTVLAQVVAEELGLEPHEVSIRIGDTAFPPGCASGGSKTTGSITPAARKAAWDAKQQMLARVAAKLKVPESAVSFDRGKVTIAGEAPRVLTFREAAGQMGVAEVSARAERGPDYARLEAFTLGGVQFAEVAVDTETGAVKVERIVAVHDCGRPMNLLGLENQINGGVLQGISYALYEDRVLDRNVGAMVNPNLEQYKIIGPKETPSIDVIVLEQYEGITATDALGVAEPATIPTSAAIANAIYNAIGVRMTELPITPAKILAALRTQREGRNA